jgi:small GTP-binding protein
MVMGEAIQRVESPEKRFIVVGKESVGKSQLISSLTGKTASASNFRGTTISVENYVSGNITFIDTPGILRDSDSFTTRLALRQLKVNEHVLLVLQATNIDEDLEELLPLVKGKDGIVAVTFWDKVAGLSDSREKISLIENATGVPFVTVNARSLTGENKESIQRALRTPKPFYIPRVKEKTGWKITPRKNIFDVPFAGQMLSVLLLFLPAWIAVENANRLADSFYGGVKNLIAPFLEIINRFPAPVSNVLGGDYGLLSMSPFLFLYAVPTVVIFSLILAVYKSSGLIDRLTVSLHPLLLSFGITGRDFVRVIMGFGCNVPAVINTRSCSSCSRGACISAISFGSACSYQLPATLAVFTAAGMSYLAPIYLILLATTTLIYLTLTVPAEARLKTNRLKLTDRDFLQLPQLKDIWRESWSVIKQFFTLALPVFFLICFIAAVLQWTGVLDFLSESLTPLMSLFNLPGEVAPAVILGSVRKDGIAIGLLDGDWSSLKAPLETPVQLLTAVYLAGVLLPCLVTLLTIVKEQSPVFTLKLVCRQALAASGFALLIAWAGYGLINILR